MKKKVPKRRSVEAAALANRCFKQRIVPSKKIYNRKASKDRSLEASLLTAPSLLLQLAVQNSELRHRCRI